ncbi:MAG: CBS domain-containing protein, partial [Firmicutes bacterium]|nr:CBS domain-containing protein [Bacillota bacterium]
PVIDDDGIFIGIVRRRDIIRSFAYTISDDIDSFK